MVTTNVGGLAEIVPDGKVGFVTEPSPGAISDAIVRFYDEKREEEFSHQVSIEKKRYSWSGMLEAIDLLMKRI